MLFPDEDAPHLKKWIVKRLENTSDADADVLADYVLALLRHDGDADAVRKLCEEEIPDFLKEDSTVFVRDVFDAIQYKSYLPGAAPAPKASESSHLPTGPAYANTGVAGAPRGPQNGSKKRSFMDRGDFEAQDGRENLYGGADINGRSFKQPRRGGNLGRGGRYDNFGNGRGARHNQGSPMNLPMQGFPNMPALPSPPPGMPLIDPNNPMAAILAMQAAGFPGMPQFPQAGSPINQSSYPPPVTKKGQRCRDYDTKGFCARGNACMYEHGNDSIYVPPGTSEEYDPTNSSIMTGVESTSSSARNDTPNFRGNDRGRGRGRGQASDRGGQSRRGGRSEFSSDRPNFDRSKTTIVVENIPEEKFSEEEVRGFFSQFGNILEVSMRPYKRLAIVKFEDWNSAKEAYNSPKVIFDNRFVKVYWFTNPESLPQPPKSNAGGPNKESRGDGSPAPARATTEPQIDMEEFTRKQEELQRLYEEKAKKKAEMEAAQKELEKRQEDLLKKQAEEKRKLMEKIAAKTGKSSEESAGTTPSNGQASSQTEVLKAQLAALEAEAKVLGLDTALPDDSWAGRGRGRGRGGYRGRAAFVPRGRGSYRGRGGFTGAVNAYKLDNRPKKIAITGVDFTDSSKDESLRQYLLGIGEFADLEATPDRTSITFKDRSTAEKFMYGINNGEIPSIGKVELSWVQTPLPPVPTASTKAASGVSGPESQGNNGQDHPTSDTGHEDGDAMVQDHDQDQGTSTAAQGNGATGGAHDHPHEQQQRNLDYDIADDNDWS